MADLLLATLAAASLLPIDEGNVTAYRRGLMAEVVEHRVELGQLDPGTFAAHRGFVAVQDCFWRGATVWVELDDGKRMGPYLAADCGGRHDQEWLDSIDFAIEGPPGLVRTWGSPGRVTVYVELEGLVPN